MSFSNLGEVAVFPGATFVDGGGNLDVDSFLVNERRGDVHLLPTSPLIDAGTCAGAPAVDFEEGPRPETPGGDCDIGADER